MSKKLTDLTLTALNNAKALDIKILDVTKLSNITDYMIIANGRSSRQVSALADKVILAAKENGIHPLGVEGKAEGEWVLIDLGDLIVHIMHPTYRDYYQLERLWDINIAPTETV